MITDEEIDKKCILPKIDFNDLILKYGYDSIENKYTPIVIQAPTGSGKTMRMLEYINNDETSGVVFCHSIEAIKELTSKLATLFDYKKKDLLEFHSQNQPLYQDLVNHPEKLSNYRWIFTYNERLFSGQLKYYTSHTESNCYIQDLDLISFVNVKHQSQYNTSRCIFIDECMSKPIEMDYTIAELNELFRLIGSDLTIKQCAVFADDKIKTKSFYNLLTKLWTYTYTKLYDKYIHCDGYDEADEVLSNDGYFIDLVRIIIKDKWTKLEYRPSVLLEIMGARGFNLIKHLFRNLVEIRDHFKKLTNVTWKVRVGIQDLPDNYPIIAFDATAEVNYKDSDFKVIKLKDLNPEYSEHEDLVNINILPYNFGERKDDNPNIINRWKNNLPEFKDHSIILWTMDAGKNENVDTKSLVENRCKDLNLTDYHFIYYGSGEIKGTNKFSSCRNIYVLSEYIVHQNHVTEHRLSTGSTVYSTKDKCIGDIVQLIGRSHIRLTRNKSKDSLDENDKVNIYLVNNIPNNIVQEVTNLVKGKYNLEDKSTLRWYVDNIKSDPELLARLGKLDRDKYNLEDENSLKDYISKFVRDHNGNKVKSNIIDKIISIVNSGFDEGLIRELCNYDKTRINNFRFILNQLN